MALVTVATATVDIVNVAELCPAAMRTVVGGIAAPALLLKVTVVPPAPAALDSVTVPVELLPPVTAVGFNEADARVPAAGFPNFTTKASLPPAFVDCRALRTGKLVDEVYPVT